MQFPALLLLACLAVAPPQDTTPTPPANGPRHLDPAWHRLVGATVHFGQDFGQDKVLEDATIVVRAGRFLYFGASPEDDRGWQRIGAAGAREWDLTDRHVYPGFIEGYVEVDADASHEEAEIKHWNSMITPQRTALDGAGLPGKEREALRALGFTAAALAPKDGILRGRGALVSLADSRDASLPGPAVHAADVYHAASLERRRGTWNEPMGAYPDSQMGAIALLRQTFMDADHRASRLAEGAGMGHALDHLGGREGSRPLCFDVADELEALRAAKILQEAGRTGFVVGTGSEFRRLDALASSGLAGIFVPLDFPQEPDVLSVGAADAVSLRALMTWEQAPTNPRRVAAAGLRAALTSARLDKKKDFWKNLRRAVAHGLSEADALAMLTLRPAEMLGVEDRLGRIAPGYVADLVVTDGPIFEEDSKILEVWIEGRRHVIAEPEDTRLDGTWTATVENVEDPVTFVVEGKKLTVRSGEAETKAKKVRFEKDRLSFLFDHEPFGEPGTFSLQGLFDGEALAGIGRRSGGAAFTWSAVRAPEDGGDEDSGDEAEEEEDEESGADEDVASVPESFGLPFGAYALDAPPEPVAWLEVKGATIWTSGPAGIVEDGTLVVENGKLTHVGGAWEGERPDGALVIDAAGKHVTPGLIDCHSHTGISKGVNEAGQAVTSEVRIADVTNPDDVNWYRQLAGGLTAANQLHGSANPIGGQNQVVKLRWGAKHPDDMHFATAKPGIKFALGENVKHSNRSRRHNVRYPQTRMGVETLMRDRFNAARDYASTLESWRAAGGDPAQAPARDLELDALAEILAGERWIHCHSYRQDEILMLCRLAQDYGFKIGTFQHILEGYKVAETIREVAVGTSAFSDWWGYKFEVQDAIPYAGAIMHDVGIVVSFNSDSSELARRMNLEAAKAVKYGGLEPSEALKFVTLNPAIQLGVDDRVGSLEVGKDADFAIWSGDPLSTYSICESTFVDGAELFSLERDRALRERNAEERRRIVQKLLAKQVVAKGKGKDKGAKDGESGEGDEAKPGGEVVDEAFVRRRIRFLELLRAGKDPEEPTCGDCGMAALEDHAH